MVKELMFSEISPKRQRLRYIVLSLLLCCFSLYVTACSGSYSYVPDSSDIRSADEQRVIEIDRIPEYSGGAYVEINGNKPEFSEEELSEQSFEVYSELDNIGRCGEAYANVGTDLMPVEERGSIGQVKPTGWHTVKYDFIDGKYLYNRCHLIGYQLSSENANEKNLITGTRYMNVEGMLPFENMVADYVKETDHHVLYRVTPVFEGDNLLAYGVQMEAFSVEDHGEAVSFNVFVYNVQPGISIDYETGESMPEETDFIQAETKEIEIRGNKRSKIYHCPGQAAYEEMEDSRNLVIFRSEQEAQEAGYRKAKR